MWEPSKDREYNIIFSDAMDCSDNLKLGIIDDLTFNQQIIELVNKYSHDTYFCLAIIYGLFSYGRGHTKLFTENTTECFYLLIDALMIDIPILSDIYHPVSLVGYKKSRMLWKRIKENAIKIFDEHNDYNEKISKSIMQYYDACVFSDRTVGRFERFKKIINLYGQDENFMKYVLNSKLISKEYFYILERYPNKTVFDMFVKEYIYKVVESEKYNKKLVHIVQEKILAISVLDKLTDKNQNELYKQFLRVINQVDENL